MAYVLPLTALVMVPLCEAGHIPSLSAVAIEGHIDHWFVCQVVICGRCSGCGDGLPDMN